MTRVGMAALRQRLVQFSSALAANAWLQGWVEKGIYTGPLKVACFPGLQCYSCPSSIASCPLGSLQSLLASPGISLGSIGSTEPLTVLAILGSILFVGFLAGRFACSHLCPFGLLQDLLYMIPAPRLRLPPGLRNARFAVLAVFAVSLPLLLRPGPGMPGDPWFCKAVCPAGTVTGGWPFALWDSGGTLETGFLFAWKSAVAVLVILWSVTTSRPFCRTLCPLGAAWGLAGRVSLFRMTVDRSCIRCGKCREVCPVDIEIWKDPSSSTCIRCGRCVPACPVAAVKNGLAK
ncbi:4Fe-4S binding protein [Candidatus Fermentibacteria bacterium]|nr:4Fe-4S binding protein [Candidatus Fermentibacteria bacterium]